MVYKVKIIADRSIVINGDAGEIISKLLFEICAGLSKKKM